MAEPIYRQIARDLRDKIESGEVPPGERLPTELELKDRYHTSRNTIRDAVKWLARRGLAETRPGRGTFATRRFEPFVTTLSADPQTGLGGGEGGAVFAEVRERGRTPSVSAPKVEVQLAPRYVAVPLRLPEGTQVLTRRQELYIDRQPWSLQMTAYPMDLVQQGAVALLMAPDIPGGTIAYLERTIGVRQIGHRDLFFVRPPDDEETRFFRVSDDVSVISLIRTGYYDSDAGPVPFRATFTSFPADRNQFVFDSGVVPREMVAPVTDEQTRVLGSV